MMSGDDRGFTLIEVLVAMIITLVVMGAATTVLTIFMKDNNYDAARDSAQADARQLIDRVSRDLRNAASPVTNSSPGTLSAGLLEKATSDDIVFEGVSPSGTAPSGDLTNEMQVRYCLGANNTLWRQSTTPSSSYTTVPDTTSCPSTSTAWVTTSTGSPCCIELTDVTNDAGGDTTRPLFTFGPTGWSSLADIKEVQIDMYVDPNPGQRPGATELTSGVFLRNEMSAPVADFSWNENTVKPGVTDVQLNGTPSSDPNGQALSYQWYTSGSCPAPAGSPFSTSQEPDAGNYSSGTNQTFLLVVTDTAGLTYCTSKVVAVQ